MKDFFISYNKADRDWAEWIAWILEEVGYSVLIQAWDFRPGENFALKMQEAAKITRKTIAVLSDTYLSALFTQPEWAAAFARDPKGERRTLIPVRVSQCEAEGILGPTIYVDLVGSPEEEARRKLLEGIADERAKPDTAPPFPAQKSMRSKEEIAGRPEYPGAIRDSEDLKAEIPSNLPAGIPFFTGREDVLSRLELALKSARSIAIAQRQAISGLGGIGKTQTAIEFARRHRGEYSALLWAVAESTESLIADFVAIAKTLKLAEANAPDQSFVVGGVKRWLRDNKGWLLILDNADEPRILEEFLPDELGGHVIITSRAQVFDVLGILNPVEVEEMSPDDARDFLLKRTGRHDLNDDEFAAVIEIARELDYLPLALEQAGAYIKELRSSFHDYLASYRRRGLELLEKGHPAGKYRKSVRTTWSLNFQQVEERSRASADLLRASAFLAPDRIPTELVTLAASDLGAELSRELENVGTDPLALDEVLQPLIQYSLIHRHRESQTFDIHRLVQAVLRDGMDEATKAIWIRRITEALSRVFPDIDTLDSSDWDSIERLLPHAQVCVELLKGGNQPSKAAANLLVVVGRYLHFRGRLDKAEEVYKSAIFVTRELGGDTDVRFATAIHNQAWLYLNQARYREAEALFLQALDIRKQHSGSEDENIASTLSQLGSLYTNQGKFTEALRTLSESLERRKHRLVETDPEIADSLVRIAQTHMEIGNIEDAKPLVNRALEILQTHYGENDWRLFRPLNDLGAIYYHEGKFAEAQSLLSRSLRLAEAAFGPNYPVIAGNLANLANVYIFQDKYREAESLLIRSLQIAETAYGADHLETCVPLGGLSRWNLRQGRYAEAEELILKCLAIREKFLGRDHPDVAGDLLDLARICRDQRSYSKGEPPARRAIEIFRKKFGLENSNVIAAMSVYASLLRGLNRKGEAQKLQDQVRKVEHKLHKKRRK